MLLGNAGLFEIDDQNADALRERGGVSIVCCEMAFHSRWGRGSGGRNY